MELEKFEQLIVNQMSEKFCNEENAMRIVQKYIHVIRTLNDNHDSAAIQAERYFKADKSGIDPSDWLEHIRIINEKYK